MIFDLIVCSNVNINDINYPNLLLLLLLSAHIISQFRSALTMTHGKRKTLLNTLLIYTKITYLFFLITGLLIMFLSINL